MNAAKVPLKLNVEYTLRDKDGKIKPLFQLNKVGRFLLKLGAISPFVKNSLFGGWQDHMAISNLVTSAGKAGVASRINGAGAEAAFDYVAIGIGTTAANIADTTLESEIVTNGGQRAQDASPTRETTDVTNDTAVTDKTFAFTGSFAVTEAGILNAASTGVLLARQVFSAINVVSGDSLAVTWKIDVD